MPEDGMSVSGAIAASPAFPVVCGECYSEGISTREYFAVQILNGLLAKHGAPCRTEVYLPDLRDLEDAPDEDLRHFLKEKKEFEQRVECYNRRAICRQAVKLADELILQLSLPAAP